jgi:HAD superfamily hydrolase (TIGR01509 family)
MEKKTFIFDFDGTLVDSMPAFIGCMLRFLDENNIKYGDDIVNIITPLGYIGSAKYFQTIGLTKSVEETVETVSSYTKYEYENNIVAKETVVETLKTMKSLGYDLNVLTASPHLVLDPCLKRNKIFDLFTNVWSCDDFSTTKADPNIYHMCAEKLGKSVGEIIFVDDNVNAVATAKSAGMIACGIYDDSSKDYVDEMKKVADNYVFSFAELLK